MARAVGADSISENVRGLLSGAERLARTEVELALAKGRDSVGETARHMGMLVVAAVFATGGMAFLLVAIYNGLALRVDSWLAALLTAIIAFAGAGILLQIALPKTGEADQTRSLAERRDGVATVQ
jgi:hypothetical protein